MLIFAGSFKCILFRHTWTAAIDMPFEIALEISYLIKHIPEAGPCQELPILYAKCADYFPPA